MTVQAALHDGHPHKGYFRMRRHKDAVWSPVAIWEHEGLLVCRVGADMVVGVDAINAIWLYCADNRVPKDDALYAFKHGRWPSDVPAFIGDNLPPSDDPFEQLTRDLETEAARVRSWVLEPHEGKTAADMAANWLTALRKLEKRTESAFDVEKAPALAESTRIDVKWRPLKALAAQIKQLMNDRYEVIARKEKKRQQEIADVKARDEAAKQRRDWEREQAKKAELAKHHNIPLEPEQAPLFPVVTEAPPVKVAFGGAAGSRVGLRKQPATAFIEDWAKVAVHYAGNAKVREVLSKLADHDARDGREIPGAKIIPGE